MSGELPTARLTIAPLIERFPAYRVAVVVLEGLSLDTADAAGVEHCLQAAEAAARERLAAGELAEIPAIKAWRQAYKGFGIKQTRYRSSLERLLRRLRGGEALPRINPLVDLYNALSIRHLMPAGADDLDRVALPLAFRYAAEGDGFLDMGTDPPTEAPPAPGEAVYADARHVLCRRWNWRQDARSMILPETRRAVVTVQALEDTGPDALVTAAEAFLGLARDFLGAAGAYALADRERPTVALPQPQIGS